MYFFYIDESGIEKESKHVFFSAIGLQHYNWKCFFNFLKEFRIKTNKEYGFYRYKEWHASKFIAGRGKLGKRDIYKSTRLYVFNQFLFELAKQSYLRIINIKCEKKQTNAHLFALNCLFNRLERFLKEKDDQAIVFIDSGHESEYRKLYRRLHVINPVPSKVGLWGDGKKYKNLPLEQFIEDPIFPDSDKSLPIQVVDFVVFALNKYYNSNNKQQSFKLDESFLKLKPILCLEASKTHPLGIVEL
ncbi:MAG: DUF3800 domain-containing protein [candidate division Zixibacteria bacterium]|nr:DUF3800 domain-containing protein [candidate division Zixibacteria bacterium]